MRPGGELIFIVPREFIKLTSAVRLNEWLFEMGGITHWIETGDAKIFTGATPNCSIFRFERGNFSRKTLYREWRGDWQERRSVLMSGQVAFARSEQGVRLGDLFDVKVGAVSGADAIFEHPKGNIEFVCSSTAATGKTRRMLYNVRHPALLRHKSALLQRRVRSFTESNWWMWGRDYLHAPERPRIYVNGRTRHKKPFFLHPGVAWDGSVLALFAKDHVNDIGKMVEKLNEVDWQDLGFVVDGRFIFAQRSLENVLLPSSF